MQKAKEKVSLLSSNEMFLKDNVLLTILLILYIPKELK